MNSLERVKTAIAHQPSDRPPYFLWLTRDAQQKVRDALGVEDPIAWLDNDILDVKVPWWNWRPAEPDWGQFETPTSRIRTIGTGSYENLEDNIKTLRDSTDKYLLVRIYGSHFEKANFARGIENFLCDIARDYDFAKRLCRSIIEKNIVMLENVLDIAEIDGVLLGSDWGSQRGLLMSPAVWDELIRPGEQEEYDLIHAYGKDVWVHSCGAIEPLIPRLIEMGLDVLNPIQPECMDIYQLKENYGRGLTFWGGVSTQKTLPFGSPEEVRNEARQVRDAMAQGGGYIFAGGQELQDDVPVENIRAMLEVARS